MMAATILHSSTNGGPIMTEEEYKEIPGFPDYAVSKTGVVISKKFGRNKPLKLGSGKWGHRYCVLYINDKRHLRLVHRLVLETYVGPCPEGMMCCHFPDKNPGNNNLENLRWGTSKDNHDDQIHHGTDTRGEKNPAAKIKAADAIRIRELYKEGKTQQAIADMYGLKQAHISSIILRKVWRCV